MLTRIKITNFQKHRKLDIKLKRVTVIVGHSDAGKSAVLRALRWAMLNKPNGKEFIRDGAKQASVMLRVDKQDLTRSRGVGSTYELNGETFTAFGSSVPEEIANLLNVSDLNFQTQHDAPFWFALSPGQVSRELNAVVDLSVMDSAMANAARATAKAKTAAELIRCRLVEAREAVESYAFAPLLAGQLDAIERQKADLDFKRLQTASIASAIENGSRHQTAATNAARARQTGLNSLQQGKTALDLADAVESLETLVEQGVAARAAAVRSIPTLDAVDAAALRCRSLGEDIGSLLDMLQAYDDLTEQLAECSEELEAAEADVATLHEQGVCPVCHQPFPSPSSSRTSTCHTSRR